MTWESRLLQSAYTDPTGERIPFQYENVSRSFDMQGTAYNFPDGSGTYVQGLGNSSDRYPMRIFFSGSNCDLDASAFEAAIKEPGIGILEHPMYGVKNVIVLGEVSRRDDLKTSANQAIIECTFWETLNIVYPFTSQNPRARALALVDEYNTASAESFAEDSPLVDPVEAATFQSRYEGFLEGVKEFLEPVAELQDGVKNRFDAINNSINQGITTLIGDPLTLGFQTIELIQSVGAAGSLITARLESYGDLADFIINGNNTDNDANFRGADLMASSSVAAMALSAINNQFDTRGEALQAATFILDEFATLNEWREQGFNDVERVDTGESYEALQELVAFTAGFLVQISFTLRQEQRITLDRRRTILDLVSELYGDIDDNLDFFIDTNNLSGSEILELPAGREIVYYE